MPSSHITKPNPIECSFSSLANWCLALLLTSLCGLAPNESSAAAPTKLSIVLFSDLSEVQEGRDGRGGLAKLASVIKSQRSQSDQVLVTFAGDAISPSLFSVFDKGAHIIDLFNQLGLSAMVLGNHEFDFGPEVTQQRISEATFPILNSNAINPDGQILPGTQASMLINVGDFKIGLFGLTTESTATKSSPGKVSFRYVTDVALEQSQALREAGAHLVVALAHTHSGEDEQLLAQGVVDIILSGDDHKLRIDYNDKNLLVESGQQGNRVTIIDLELSEVEKKGVQRFTWSPSFRVIDTVHVTPDPEMTQAVQSYLSQLSQELDVEIGKTLTAMDSRQATIRSQEAAISNFIADAIREIRGGDAFISNTGGIRGNTLYNPGQVLTRRDIFRELPFHNNSILMEVKGKDILAALENGLRNIEEGFSGSFPHISGLRVTYDPALPSGSRVTHVSLTNGEALVLEKTYKLATSSFLAGGGDGYTMFTNKKHLGIEKEALLSVQLIEYIEKKKVISPRVDGRLQAID